MPAMADWSCPPSLNALSMTLISVAVVSSPVKAVQSACERSQTQFLSLSLGKNAARETHR